jgi:ferredoxin-NADP reductase
MMAIDSGTPARQLEWQFAEVHDVVVETGQVKTLLLQPARPFRHLPGQHVDVRLTADGGYHAQRSYSITSAPEDELLALTVERVPDGEVSPYLIDELHPGDKLQLRGPIGGHFVWESGALDPLYLIAGGAGVTPLMAMLRHRWKAERRVPAVLFYSARSHLDLIFRAELDAMTRDDASLRVAYTLTREQPAGWEGRRGRIDKKSLASIGFPASQSPAIYVCGPTGFVEGVSSSLVELGYDAVRIKTERFGPSG